MLQGTRYRIAEEPVAHIDYDTFHVHGLLSGLCLATWMQNVLLYQGYHTAPRLRKGHKGQNCESFFQNFRRVPQFGTFGSKMRIKKPPFAGGRGFSLLLQMGEDEVFLGDGNGQAGAVGQADQPTH